MTFLSKLRFFLLLCPANVAQVLWREGQKEGQCHSGGGYGLAFGSVFGRPSGRSVYHRP